MNIDLLSKMVRELLLDNERVALPGLGCFVTEMVPAVFSDRGFTINPPYRKLYFRDGNGYTDDLVVDFYASSNDVPKDVAAKVVEDFVAELRELLNSRKNVVFPELGKLRATKENNYFFVPFENVDIYPEGVGLDRVSLKVHAEPEETEHVASHVFPDWELLEVVDAAEEKTEEIGVVEPVVEKTGEVEAAEPAEEPKEEKPEEKRKDEVEVTEEKTDEVGEVTEETEEKTEETESAEPEEKTEKVEAAESEEEKPEVVESEEERKDEVEVVEVTEEKTDEVEVAEPAEEPAEEVEVTEEKPEEKPAVVEEAEKKRGLPTFWKVVLIVIGAAIVLFIVFVILTRVAPDFTDKLLYTKEELQILNAPLP